MGKSAGQSGILELESTPKNDREHLNDFLALLVWACSPCGYSRHATFKVRNGG
jgi:hypothetical protein